MMACPPRLSCLFCDQQGAAETGWFSDETWGSPTCFPKILTPYPSTDWWSIFEEQCNASDRRIGVCVRAREEKSPFPQSEAPA